MIGMIIVPVASLLVFWAWQLLNWAWLRPRKIERMFRKQGMKGNPYRFFLGDTEDTIRMYKDAITKPIGLHDDVVPRIMPNIYNAVKEHGDFCFIWAGPRPRVFIMDPQIAQNIINKRREFLKPFKTSNETVKMLVTGLAAMEGEHWSKTRSVVTPMFKLDKLKMIIPAIQRCTEDVLEEFREMAEKGGGSCVVEVLRLLISSLLTKLMFNCPYTDEVKETFLLLDELAELAGIHARSWSYPGEKYLPSKVNRRANAIDKYVRASFTSIINERLKNRRTQEVEHGYKDLLDVFMGELYQGNFSKKEHERLIEEVIGNLRIFFFGGFETTANLITWSLIMLAYHQDCQDRARQEILEVLGNKDKITSDDVGKLKYLSRVLNETLRLYPPAVEITRVTGEDATIEGYKIPKDTLLTFPLLMYHRDTKIWGEDAREFKPDRFADGVVKATEGKNAFMPFGWGPRICIGMNLSLLESKIIIAMLLRNFSLEPSPAYAHAPFVTFTLQPQFGAPLVFKKL